MVIPGYPQQTKSFSSVNGMRQIDYKKSTIESPLQRTYGKNAQVPFVRFLLRRPDIEAV